MLFEFKETEPEVKNRAIGALFSILRWLYGKYDMTHPLWDLEMNYKPFIDGLGTLLGWWTGLQLLR